MLTADQIELRKKGLGASDMAAVMGLDPYRSAGDVYLEKTGQLTELEETPAMQLGNLMEGGILDYAELQLGPLKRNVYVKGPDFENIPIASNLDAQIITDPDPVEAKAYGIFRRDDRWGDEETDYVPNGVLIQCLTQIYCTERDKCHIAALLGGRGLQMFLVERNERMIKLILKAAIEFTECVRTKTPPPDSVPHLEVLKRVRREPEKVVDVASKLVQAWLDAKEANKEAEGEKEEAQAKLIAALGDAEAGRCPLGLFRYVQENAGMKIKAKEVKEKYPDVYKELAYNSTRMMSRFKKAK